MSKENSVEGHDARAVTINDRSLMNLTTAVLKAINSPTSSVRVAKADLPARIGISGARVNAILNPGSQKSTKIALDELGKVVAFARKFSAGLPMGPFRDLVSDYCNKIAQRLHEGLERDGLSPTEFAFVTNLKLFDDHKQQNLSDRHAGVYALIRLDRDGHILTSRLDIHPRRNLLCRFATDSGHPGTGEPTVEGYLFAVDDGIQAVGRPETASGLRTSILRSHRPPKETRWDLMGLRLGISNFDGGAYAYRIYCRRIAEVDKVGAVLPDFADLFGARRFEAIDDIEISIPDVADILTLLREPDDEDTPWGIRIPTGIRFDD